MADNRYFLNHILSSPRLSLLIWLPMHFRILVLGCICSHNDSKSSFVCYQNIKSLEWQKWIAARFGECMGGCLALHCIATHKPYACLKSSVATQWYVLPPNSKHCWQGTPTMMLPQSEYPYQVSIMTFGLSDLSILIMPIHVDLALFCCCIVKAISVQISESEIWNRFP